MKTKRKPKLAVWKFASCDGCQLSLLDCEDELLAVAGALEIASPSDYPVFYQVSTTGFDIDTASDLASATWN